MKPVILKKVVVDFMRALVVPIWKEYTLPNLEHTLACETAGNIRVKFKIVSL